MLAVAIVVVLGIALILAATPVTDPDGVGYHVAALKWWMEAQTLIALPTYIHTYSPMGGEAVMGLGFATWSDTSVKVIHWAFGALTLVALYGAGSRLTNHIGGLANGGALSRLCLPAILVGLHRSRCRSLRGDRVFGLGSLAPKQ